MTAEEHNSNCAAVSILEARIRRLREMSTENKGTIFHHTERLQSVSKINLEIDVEISQIEAAINKLKS